MSSNYSEDQEVEGDLSTEHASQPPSQPISLPLFAVQLQNIIPVEIIARRFPGEKGSTAPTPISQINPASAQMNLEEPVLNREVQRAQVPMSLQVLSTDIPTLFEISLKLIGVFSYDAGYGEENVLQYLRLGSMSAMLPFARELLLNMCVRLQMPLIALPLVQLAPPPPDPKAGDTPQA